MFGSEFYSTPNLSKIIPNKKIATTEQFQESHNTLVLLVNFLDSGPNSFTKEEAHELIFKGQFDAYMKEQSYNKVDFEGDVFGWLTINKNSIDACALGQIQGEIDGFAVDNAINIENYDHILYILNCVGNSGSYSTIGDAPVVLGGHSANLSWSVIGDAVGILGPISNLNIQLPFTWTEFDQLLSHELGHAMGLLHANGFDCGTTQITSPCSHVEYGNPFDAMGNWQLYALHYNAYYKYLLGWLSNSDIFTISQSGIYNLSPIESSGISKKLALIKLPGQENPIYAVEYRAPVGFDSNLQQPLSNKSGLYINKTTLTGNGYIMHTQLIDSQPSTLEWFSDTEISFLGSQKFVDVQNGITIQALAPGTSAFNVKIQPTSFPALP